jgi:hypothetical protein
MGLSDRITLESGTSQSYTLSFLNVLECQTSIDTIYDHIQISKKQLERRLSPTIL